jgi:hypothetical protein
LGGGWSGYSTSGGVTTGGYYTTQSFLNTGNNAGIFRKLTSSGTVITSEAVLGNANYAGQLTYGNYQAKIGTASEAVRAAYSTTQVVSLGTSTHAIDITAGDFKYGAITIAAPPNSYSYLDGTGTWRDLVLDGTSSVTSNFTGLRPGWIRRQQHLDQVLCGRHRHVPARLVRNLKDTAMKIEDREQVLAIVQQLLEDNANNRITLSLAQGIIATARGLLNVDPPAQPAPPPQLFENLAAEAAP